MAGKGGFIPGSGRKKGTPNKKTVEAQEIAKRLKCDPFELLILYAKGDWKALGYKSETVTKFIGNNMVEEPVISAELRATSARNACEYIYPKRKAIEQSIAEDTITHITRTILTKKV
jgi:hypothetical protein